jgi:hypothetical protein
MAPTVPNKDIFFMSIFWARDACRTKPPKRKLLEVLESNFCALPSRTLSEQVQEERS